MWEYCEATPSTWLICMSLGEPVSAEVAGPFGITCEPGVSCLGYADTKGVMSDFRALDDTIDWGVVEMTTGVSLPGRVQHLKDGTLIDHTLCGSIVPVSWSPAWTRQAALSQGCVVAIEGVWAYNSSGANELRDGETGSIIAKNGTVLAAGGSYATSDVGAWRFTYLYGSSKTNEGTTRVAPASCRPLRGLTRSAERTRTFANLHPAAPPDGGARATPYALDED